MVDCCGEDCNDNKKNAVTRGITRIKPPTKAKLAQTVPASDCTRADSIAYPSGERGYVFRGHDHASLLEEEFLMRVLLLMQNAVKLKFRYLAKRCVAHRGKNF